MFQVRIEDSKCHYTRVVRSVIHSRRTNDLHRFKDLASYPTISRAGFKSDITSTTIDKYLKSAGL